ncbi:hypothetical protein D9611_011044 [Ephemerocybe angulata]|uniref:NOT2/NOT3/NOT5 C-terminal domain-containing protein n=1 Tax=Ephemerocybe angulata TaxID=980116 RepID=A0A8H5BB98_9AGAR|nr:hypothetical protein D9611_011044 [Tulosesus angulatus]
MNRAGQPQQRGPSLATTPGITGPFRPPFPGYPMPPRNVLQSGGYVPNLQPNSHRTGTQPSQVPSMTPQPTPGFMQARGQGSFAFGGGALGQHQGSAPLQQQQQQQQQLSSQQQQQTNGTSTPMPPHLTQSSIIGTPSIASSTEVALDPNDFPVLGSTPTNTTSSSGTAGGTAAGGTSYASQAGTGVSLAGSSAGGIGSASGNQPRDFTPDDFPALGGQSHNSQSQNGSQNQNSNSDSIPHPPGLNGFQQEFRSRNLLGDLSGGIPQGTPGMLNLGPQARNVHPGFQQNQTESDKLQRSNYSLKQAAHAAWNSPNSASQSQQAGGTATNGTSQTSLPSHLNAPPGVPPPTGSYPQQQQSGNPNLPTNGPYPSDGLPSGDANVNVSAANANGTSHPNPTPSSNPNSSAHPQTPAQQVLISAADRWGLLSLITLMKTANSELDHGLSSIGTDLGTMGLDMSYPGNLYSTFITPWADQSAAHQVEPDFHLPACYLSVQAPPPGPSKAALFSDETLFFMFYSSPRDALQEVAAQELWNRNWRWHKELRLWITKESGTAPSNKVQGGEQGLYTFWDPESWQKERKEMTVLYADLEEKSSPAFMPGSGLVPSHQATPQTPGGGPAPQQQQQHAQSTQLGAQLPNQGPTPQRATFPMGVAGL